MVQPAQNMILCNLDFFFLKKKSKRVDGVRAVTLGKHLGGMSCSKAFR